MVSDLALSGHVHGIDNLSDVDTTTALPLDGQALIWDNSSSKWEPGNVSSGTWTSSPEAASLDGNIALKKQSSDPSETVDYIKIYSKETVNRPPRNNEWLFHFDNNANNSSSAGSARNGTATNITYATRRE